MEVSTQRKWDPTRWNAAAGRANGTKEDARALNAHLDTLQGKVYEAQRQLIADSEEITIRNIRARLEGRRGESRMLLEIFKDHNEKLAQLVNKEFAPGTLERYETALSHTAAFIQWKYKKTDMDINELNYSFATEFEFWFKTVRSNLKKIINLCMKQGGCNGILSLAIR